MESASVLATEHPGEASEAVEGTDLTVFLSQASSRAHFLSPLKDGAR